jgi:hypothetical protein
MAASECIAMGKGEERAWLLSGVSIYYCVLLAMAGVGSRVFDFGVILPAGKVIAVRHGPGCSS